MFGDLIVSSLAGFSKSVSGLTKHLSASYYGTDRVMTALHLFSLILEEVLKNLNRQCKILTELLK